MNRFALALPLLGLFLVPADGSAKPSKKNPPSAKAQPTPAAPLVPKTAKIAREHLDNVERAKPLSNKAKIDRLAKAGMKVTFDDLGEPVTVTVRNPRPQQGVHVAFVGLNMILAQRDRGTAVIGQLNDMNDYDDAPKPEPAPSDGDTLEVPEAIAFPHCFLPIPCSADPEGSVAPARPQRELSYVTLRFRAAANTAYIVDCMASAEGKLYSQTIVDKAIVDDDDSLADGQYDLLVSSGPRRNIRIDLFAKDAWTFRQCQITPVA